jgi:hypothetical protein
MELNLPILQLGSYFARRANPKKRNHPSYTISKKPESSLFTSKLFNKQ